MTFIYALTDPVTDEVRYVGKADRVKVRYVSHLREAKSGKDSYKCNWIRQLINNGQMPKLIVLEEISQDEWKKAEIYYIKEFKRLGHNLTNLTKGGEGFETGYVQDHLFTMKKYLGKRYNELKKSNEFALLNRVSTTMSLLAFAKPHFVPKRWLAIQLP
jgi:hypothetical protein